MFCCFFLLVICVVINVELWNLSSKSARLVFIRFFLLFNVSVNNCSLMSGSYPRFLGINQY